MRSFAVKRNPSRIHITKHICSNYETLCMKNRMDIKNIRIKKLDKCTGFYGTSAYIYLSQTNDIDNPFHFSLIVFLYKKIIV